jgi:hypothetical protein
MAIEALARIIREGADSLRAPHPQFAAIHLAPQELMRDMNDFSGVLREASWILGSIGAAIALCYFAPEYGYTPVAFFSVSFYVLTGVLRLLIRAWRRFAAR